MPSGRFDAAVCHQVLEHIPRPAAALGELHRVLKPGGVLRLALPDLDRGIAAYQNGQADYFHVPDDDARSIGANPQSPGLRRPQL